MKPELLEILHCPHCQSPFHVQVAEENGREIRCGFLQCTGPAAHRFEIVNGIIRIAVGFDHALVQKEIEYENSSYHGSPRLTDPDLIAQFPDTLSELWPHTLHFGPDFKDLIDTLNIKPEHWVLDVGTGPCWSSRLLAQHRAKVIALDVNDSRYYGLGTGDLLFARHNIYFERILESMTHLPFARESIDRITFNASFHHTPDQGRTLRECYRVLKPGGMIAMVNEEFGSLRQALFRNEAVTDGGSHHSVPYSRFEREGRETGFHIRYFLAGHVRQQLEQKFPGFTGKLITRMFEATPLALKQLNSALIILTKTGWQADARQEKAIPLFQHA